MRSYYAHLEAMNKENFLKPVFRSSAIFPVFHNSSISTRILFMGYWMLKRHIQEITALVTLRNDSGKIVNRKEFSICEAKSFKIECLDYLKEVNHQEDFTGSIELEFFSNKNLVFPFPAAVTNYYGQNFCSVVHTAQRIYNDWEDLHNNSLTKVPEGGFNLYADENHEPFITFINGPKPLFKQLIQLQFFNQDQQKMEHFVPVDSLAPYQTVTLYPAKLINLQSFFKENAGTIKLSFDLNWIFPRLLVGNLQKNSNTLTITHTYYDCSEAKEKTDYWFEYDPDWYQAALSLPVLIKGDYFTNFYFYPIYSPSFLEIDIEIYNQKGHLLGTKKQIFTKDFSNLKFEKIEIKKICLELKIKEEEFLSARLIAKAIPKVDEKAEKNFFPSRIKIALDIGTIKTEKMPCNICTNLLVFNPVLENKALTFRWAPLLMDQSKVYLWILNSSPKIERDRSIALTLRCYRENDTTFLERKMELLPNEFFVLDVKNDDELLSFFQNEIGWCTVTSSEPYTSLYYFIENQSGIVGGDHGF